MRLDDYRTSDNVQDDRGNGGGFGGGGFGGFGGLLFGLVLSRFGIGGVLILLLGYCALSTLGGGGSSYGVSGPGTAPSQTSRTGGGSICAASAENKLSCQVLASTEDTWSRILASKGQRYTPTRLAFYTGEDQRSGCGVAQSAMGPFYCPSDGRIYLDTSFFSELQNRFGAKGQFAEAYVIAHEVGHHIQDLNGTLGQVEQRQQAVSTTEGNALQVRTELQADCLAGVWAANAKSREGQPILEPGDAEAGLRAASAIGDDTLQRETQGTVVPDSFTHGTSAQRVAWLRKGLESGDPAACDTFGTADANPS
jgi:predicted metalloprotease